MVAMVDSPHNGPVMPKVYACDDVILTWSNLLQLETWSFDKLSVASMCAVNVMDNGFTGMEHTSPVIVIVNCIMQIMHGWYYHR